MKKWFIIIVLLVLCCCYTCAFATGVSFEKLIVKNSDQFRAEHPILWASDTFIAEHPILRAVDEFFANYLMIWHAWDEAKWFYLPFTWDIWDDIQPFRLPIHEPMLYIDGFYHL